MNRVLNRIRKDNKEFVTSEEIKSYCEKLYFNYRLINNYLISRGLIVKVLDDLYYVKSDDEIRKKRLKYSILEIIAKGLKLKRIDNWYFGLYTALKLIKIKVDHKNKFLYLINDKISNDKPINILGKKFRFLRFNNALFNFGIIDNGIRYSDHEKTILDFIYLLDYNQMNENRILIEISKIIDGISEEKIMEYSQYYPESNRDLLIKSIDKFISIPT